MLSDKTFENMSKSERSHCMLMLYDTTLPCSKEELLTKGLANLLPGNFGLVLY